MAARTSPLELKVPPVALALVLAPGMWLLARFVPWLSFPFPGKSIVGLALLAAGGLVALAGVVAFRRARTTVDPTKPEKASALVTAGIYRFTRNPMYVGILLVLGAFAAHLSNLAALAALPVFVAYMNRFQIAPEERALRARFGDEFAAYARSVRRWF
jgi:protein-S-isoprenylcysteine O-methyltransferase Ste14